MVFFEKQTLLLSKSDHILHLETALSNIFGGIGASAHVENHISFNQTMVQIWNQWYLVFMNIYLDWLWDHLKRCCQKQCKLKEIKGGDFRGCFTGCLDEAAKGDGIDEGGGGVNHKTLLPLPERAIALRRVGAEEALKLLLSCCKTRRAVGRGGGVGS